MRRIALRVFPLWILLILPWAAKAQRQPASAHVNLYFAQIADGQFGGGRWQTSLTFVNANPADTLGEVRLFRSDGGPLEVDFGNGPVSRFPIRVPARGSLTLSSRPTTLPVRSGWARVYADAPLVGSASFRLWISGRAVQEVTAPPTLPVIDSVSYANRELGVAVANPNNRVLQVQASLATADGSILGSSVITLPPYGHTAFNVRDKFPAADFRDSVLALSGVDRPGDEFLAWTMNADASGTFSSLPPGGVTPPISHWDRIWNVYQRVLNAAQNLGLITAAPRLTILYDKQVNAFARAGAEVGVYMGLSELLGDSDSELAYVVGHELGHIYQQRTGALEFHSNPEFDADIWGTILALISGYDAYAAAGALAKLAMATGTAGLATQFEQQLAADAHKSFNTRISEVFATLSFACSMEEAQSSCEFYKRILHPHLPDSAPLDWDDLQGRGYRQPASLRSLARDAMQPGAAPARERE